MGRWKRWRERVRASDDPGASPEARTAGFAAKTKGRLLPLCAGAAVFVTVAVSSGSQAEEDPVNPETEVDFAVEQIPPRELSELTTQTATLVSTETGTLGFGETDGGDAALVSCNRTSWQQAVILARSSGESHSTIVPGGSCTGLTVARDALENGALTIGNTASGDTLAIWFNDGEVESSKEPVASLECEDEKRNVRLEAFTQHGDTARPRGDYCAPRPNM